jgi:iron complex transport system substrate-binding protein
MRALVLVASVLTLLIAGCGGSDSDTSTTAATSSTPVAASAARFPATATHAFGTTTVPAEPQRIVVAGLTEQDTVLALGEQPIATTEWYGERPYAVWPWARQELGSAKPTVLHNTDGFDYEKIAELRPDLIIGVNAGMKRSDYEKLSKIAPTVASPVGGTQYFSPWDEQVVLIAQALGREEDGRALVDDVKARFAQVAAAHPDFAGKTASFAQNGFYSGLIYAYPDGLNTEFLTYLGFEMNPKVTALATKRGEQVGISAERLSTLDADVIVFATEQPGDVAKLEKVPTFKALQAVADHRAVFTDGTLAAAMYFMTPLSLDYVAERIGEPLQAAVDGTSPRRTLDDESA